MAAVSQNPFESSDSVRSAKPLRYAQSVKIDQPIQLEIGGQLAGVTVAYETYGQLNNARDNAVLVCHAISGDSHVARHDEQDDPGWWDIAVGPGKAIDTNRYFVICPNLLGSCRGTTGPGSHNPATGKPYGRDFPTITVGDMVAVQRRLLEGLGISQLLAVVGGKMLWESFQTHEDEKPVKKDPTAGWSLLVLSVATSIDALAVGLSLAMVESPILLPSAVIAIVCAAFTALGMLLGRRIGKWWGQHVETLGGLILIGIGIKILLDHLSA